VEGARRTPSVLAALLSQSMSADGPVLSVYHYAESLGAGDAQYAEAY
jgi:hypothetical protein